MNIIFGDFIANLPPSQEYLVLSFSPGSVPLQKRWRNNGLSADFLADYFSTFLPCNEQEPVSDNRRAEMKSAVSYIANELLENAMKYNSGSSLSPITLQLHLNYDNIIFQITNNICLDTEKEFQAYIKELVTSDPNELYVLQLEKSLAEENQTASGLGFLTMLNDYGAKLGWKFEHSLQELKEVVATTMVQLKI